MKAYRVVANTKVLRDAHVAAHVEGTLGIGQKIQGDPAPGFASFIVTSLPNLSSQPVFVFNLDLVEDVPPVPVPILAVEHDVFCGLVTWAAREYQVDRDLLLTMAFCLSSSLTDVGVAGGIEAGPYKLSETIWAAATTTGPAKNLGLAAIHRYLWYKQPAVAALITAESLKTLTAALGQTPTRSELFFGYLFGADAPAMLTGNRAQPISAAPLDGSYAATLKATSASVAAAVLELSARLDLAYRAAKLLVDRQPDDVRLLYPEANVFPWLALARAEMQKGVAEIPGSADNAQIVAYHAATGIAGGDGTAWCGSFVTYCMLKCGTPEAAQGVRTPASAGAAWWTTYGVAAPNPPPIGSIVVLRPQVLPSSGHVGFFEGMDGGRFKLLAGNQGGVGGLTDHVGIVSFAATEVVATVLPAQWQNLAAAQAPAAGAGRLDLTQFAGSRLAMAEKIKAAFSGAGYGTLQQAAAIANAVGESDLDPNSHAGGAEDSVGLFQLNRAGGEGMGHSIAELKDPDKNIAIVLGVFAKRIPGFKTAATLADAITIFVRDFERPKDQPTAIARRLAIAKTLLA
jgi:uncharacterized protein (TIGR02594 family)